MVVPSAKFKKISKESQPNDSLYDMGGNDVASFSSKVIGMSRLNLI